MTSCPWASISSAWEALACCSKVVASSLLCLPALLGLPSNLIPPARLRTHGSCTGPQRIQVCIDRGLVSRTLRLSGRRQAPRRWLKNTPPRSKRLGLDQGSFCPRTGSWFPSGLSACATGGTPAPGLRLGNRPQEGWGLVLATHEWCTLDLSASSLGSTGAQQRSCGAERGQPGGGLVSKVLDCLWLRYGRLPGPSQAGLAASRSPTDPNPFPLLPWPFQPVLSTPHIPSFSSQASLPSAP